MSIRQTQMRWGTKNNPAFSLKCRFANSAKKRNRPITLAKVNIQDDNILIEQKFPYDDRRRD